MPPGPPDAADGGRAAARRAGGLSHLVQERLRRGYSARGAETVLLLVLLLTVVGDGDGDGGDGREDEAGGEAAAGWEEGDWIGGQGQEVLGRGPLHIAATIKG